MKGAPELLRSLAEVDRRIDNMRFLLGFQAEKRERILADLRRAIGRTEPRTTPVDAPAAAPAGLCGLCGVEAEEGGTARVVRAASGAHVVMDGDLALIDMGVLTPGDGAVTETVAVGAACKARLGDGWWRRSAPKDEA